MKTTAPMPYRSLSLRRLSLSAAGRRRVAARRALRSQGGVAKVPTLAWPRF